MERALTTPSYSMEIIRNIYSLPMVSLIIAIEGCLKLDIRRNSNFQILGFLKLRISMRSILRTFSQNVTSNLI